MSGLKRRDTLLQYCFRGLIEWQWPLAEPGVVGGGWMKHSWSHEGWTA
jgi:hypothetical protein